MTMNAPNYSTTGWNADISAQPSAPGHVTAAIFNLASAIEMLACDGMFTDSYSEQRRLGAIEAIAQCIGELSLPLSEIFDGTGKRPV